MYDVYVKCDARSVLVSKFCNLFVSKVLLCFCVFVFLISLSVFVYLFIDLFIPIFHFINVSTT